MEHIPISWEHSQSLAPALQFPAYSTPGTGQGKATSDGQAQSSTLIHRHDDGGIDKKSSVNQANKVSCGHWRVPTIMISALLSGIAFAVGHHLFYASYHGTLVQGSMGQQWVNRIGTAFAFLVKTALAIATGSAYVQRQWLSLGSRPNHIAQVDCLFGILGDATLFVDRVWFSNVLLFVLAGMTWLLPFAAIVTPGSLIVEPRLKVDNNILKPPQLEYNASEFASIGWYGWQYNGPTVVVSRTAIAAASSGQVLQINSANQNESYTLQFFGPAVKCALNDQVREAIQKTMVKTNDTMCLGGVRMKNGTRGCLGFAAWVPSDSVHGPPAYDFTSSEAYTTVEQPPLDAPALYPNSSLRLMLASRDGLGSNKTLRVHECVLHNASYVTDFKFQYPNQVVTLRSIDIQEPVDFRVQDIGDYLHLPPTAPTIGPVNRRLSYAAIMDAFGSILVGGADYSVIIEGLLIDGGSASSYGDPIIPFGGTRFTQTKLDFRDANTTERSLEQLFQNITLSMLAAHDLTKNHSSASQIIVQVTTYPNIYVYFPFDLWLPYGIAIAATVFCVAIGFEAVLRNGATYSNRFSTILRTTRDGHFDALVKPDDDGSDPLPKSIAHAELLHEGHKSRGTLRKSGTRNRSNSNRRNKVRWTSLSLSNKSENQAPE